MRTDILAVLGCFHWRKVYGLGFACDFGGVDRYFPAPWATRRECNVKIYLGPLLICFGFPVSRWKRMA